MKKGFTLIELLVVVLIIGILAAIALPQYQKAVEKARLAEALANIKTIKDTFNLFLMQNGGRPSEEICLKDMGGTQLTGGNWSDNGCNYTTKYFQYYYPSCSQIMCSAEISPISYDYTFTLDDRHDHENHVDTCWTQNTEMGRYICNSVKSQGWKYLDEGY